MNSTASLPVRPGLATTLRGTAMNLALLGPSGVGKGTHAATLAARYRLRHVATGDLFRHHLRARSALGRIAEKYIARGELVPDEVVDAMIDEWGDALPADEGMLFDGFPRTRDQVAFLDTLLTRLGRELDGVVYLHVSDDEITRRLAGRIVCPDCDAAYHRELNPPAAAARCDRCGSTLQPRADDTRELVRTRLRVFHRRTEPVLEHYARTGRLMLIEGAGAIPTVRLALESRLDALRMGTGRFTRPDEVMALAAGRSRRRTALPGVATSLDIALLGGPGSGKGTQATALSAALHLPHVATGDLFRQNVAQGTPLGLLAKSYMDRGDLVPDDVTDAIVEERLQRPDAGRGFILDGFPRTRHQAEALNDLLARMHRRLSLVIYIDVPDETILERLAGRMVCGSCQAPYHRSHHPPRKPGICDRCGGPLYSRNDDTPETIRKRLATFHRQTEPLIAFYRAAGLLHVVAGAVEAPAVQQACLRLIRRFGRPPPPVTIAAPATPGRRNEGSDTTTAEPLPEPPFTPPANRAQGSTSDAEPATNHSTIL